MAMSMLFIPVSANASPADTAWSAGTYRDGCMV